MRNEKSTKIQKEMKQITTYITEKLKLGKNNILYHPSTKHELIKIIEQLVTKNGYDANLNCIDTSKITDMSFLFKNIVGYNLDVDISKWDVSNVKNMNWLFDNSTNIFNCDISGWDVSNVIEANGMLGGCIHFNQDISNWNVSKLKSANMMFIKCTKFDQDLSKWDVSNLKDTIQMFDGCGISKNHKPKISQQ